MGYPPWLRSLLLPSQLVPRKYRGAPHRFRPTRPSGLRTELRELETDERKEQMMQGPRDVYRPLYKDTLRSSLCQVGKMLTVM